MKTFAIAWIAEGLTVVEADNEQDAIAQFEEFPDEYLNPCDFYATVYVDDIEEVEE